MEKLGFTESKVFKYFVLLIGVLLLLTTTFSCSREKEAKTRVRIGYLQNDLHHLALWVALEKGLFVKEGIDVEIGGIFRAGPEEMSAFASGCLDIGYVGEAPATTAVANKVAGVKVLAQVNKEGSAIVVNKHSNIKSVLDLQAKTIAIPGHSTVQDFLLRKALLKNGIGLDKVKIIVIKPPEMIVTLESGEIDAFIAWEPYPAKAVTKGIGRILVTSHDIWEHHPCCVLVADMKFMGENPDVTKKMVKVHVNATDYIRTHTDEAIKIGVKFTGMDKATVQSAIRNIEFDYIPSIEGEIEYVEFLSRLGYIKIRDPKAFTHSFIDESVLEEIITK